MTNIKKAAVTLFKKQRDESYVPDACKKIGVADTTLYRWIRREFVPAKLRIGGLVLKDSAVEKIRIALGTHKRDTWQKHVVFDSHDGFVIAEAAAAPSESMASIPHSRQEFRTLSPKQKEMSQMAKRLHALQEPELAARVSHRVVMEMDL